MKSFLALALLIGLAGFLPARTHAQVITYQTEAKAMVETCLGHVHRWGTDPDELLNHGLIKRRMFGTTTYAKLPKHTTISGRGGRLNVLEARLSKSACTLYYAPARPWVQEIRVQTEQLVMTAGYKLIDWENKSGKVRTRYTRNGAVLRVSSSYRGNQVFVSFFNDNS